jgi:hypothetical protein
VELEFPSHEKREEWFNDLKMCIAEAAQAGGGLEFNAFAQVCLCVCERGGERKKNRESV